MRSPLLLALPLVLLVSSGAEAQRAVQLWGNVTLDWVKSGRVTYELDFEPKTLIVVPEGEPNWKNLDITPSLVVAAKNWLDLTVELTTGYTKQTDEIASFELTPRLGTTFHLLSRGLPTIIRGRERPPKRRLDLYNDLRVEWRNFFYSDDEPDSSIVRFRNRLGCRFALNREKITDDGARYLIGDWEWFIPLSDPTERFANRQRIRVGIGYRPGFSWRFEAMYMWTRSRDTTGEGFATVDSSINIRLKRVF